MTLHLSVHVHTSIRALTIKPRRRWQHILLPQRVRHIDGVVRLRLVLKLKGVLVLITFIDVLFEPRTAVVNGLPCLFIRLTLLWIQFTSSCFLGSVLIIAFSVALRTGLYFVRAGSRMKSLSCFWLRDHKSNKMFERIRKTIRPLHVCTIFLIHVLRTQVLTARGLKHLARYTTSLNRLSRMSFPSDRRIAPKLLVLSTKIFQILKVQRIW